MTPQQIINELDKHVIGQKAAKRAAAIALRNRWRRSQVDEQLRPEITPKNILMIGPTGVGKTEIARRLAQLAHAPFIKVEATRFTEIGYVGRDVESIIRDLTDAAINQIREEELRKVREQAEGLAEARVLDTLLPLAKEDEDAQEGDETKDMSDSKARRMLREKLRAGDLDEREISVELSVPSQGVGMEIMTPPGMEEMGQQLRDMFRNLGSVQKRTRRLKVAKALRLMVDEEADSLIEEDKIRSLAVECVEQFGIVFIDEIDKVARNREGVQGMEVSREGVQRDLLPLIEGTTVSTRHGMVKTDHILFIASGAFHTASPADLIPELQGRFPIRVELKALQVEDFVRILVEPDASLTRQYKALLATEGYHLEFNQESVQRMAEIAWQVNENMENIGARRLHTVMERLLEEISFKASELHGTEFEIDVDYVNQQLQDLMEDGNLSRFIL
ncbi:MAG: ATP-dependent protease ATPase subunit HslU [Candidatus Eutrophobiaceae bacterium]